MGRLSLLGFEATREESLMAPRRNLAVATVTAPIRAAIYCRVSSDERLGQSFNSLHAQREAGESYINSQRAEGWTVVADEYSDGGLTGANTNRPGLQKLLADVEAGKIDRVVVYKLDRLSRSMRDFLNLLDFFERHDVGFVCVSQAFDTGTPIGKMTLNLLASFGEFERQVIAERTRDKLAASRRKGKSVGGYPILGYDHDPGDGHLVVNASEVEMVREIFRLFLEKRSLVRVVEELAHRHWTLKRWTTRDGKTFGGTRFNKVNLRRLLQNHTYIGKVNFEGTIYDGDHDAIVAQRVFKEVQSVFAQNRRDGGAAYRNQCGALLRGIIRCTACGRAMTHAWSRGRHGKCLYRYYSCQRAQKQGAAACLTKSVPAKHLEDFVVGEIRRIGADPGLQEATFHQAVAQQKALRRGLTLETKRLADDLTRARDEVERLVGTLSRTTGPAADAVAAELTKAQDRVATLTGRLDEIATEETALAAQTVDQADLARALEAFDPIWEVLLVPERERVLKLLIERIDYNGGTGDLRITWRLSGLANFAAEVGGDAS